MNMRNKKISGWLKALCALLAVLGILMFGLVIREWLVFYVGGASLVVSIVATLYTALFCYLCLFQFYHVSVEIGNDNSFSLENAKAFQNMGIFAICMAVGYGLRILLLGILGALTYYNTAVFAILLVVCLVFFVLCKALSALVRGAYEMKQENDLTI